MQLFDRKTFTVPDGALLDSGQIEVSGDVVISDRATVVSNVKTTKGIFVGERVRIKGDLESGEGIRVDRWTNIEGNVTTTGSAHLGDRVSIKGKLWVEGDLDLGSDVEVGEYEAKGWINIRSPIPIIFYIILYLLDLIRKGRGEEVDQILDELESVEEDIIISPDFIFVSDKSYVNVNDIYARGKLRLGDEVKVRVNLRTNGDVYSGQSNDLVGNIIAKGNIRLGPNTRVVGELRADGDIFVSSGCEIIGNIYGSRIEIDSSCTVEGVIIARNGVKLLTPETRIIEEKLERFERSSESLTAMLD